MPPVADQIWRLRTEQDRDALGPKRPISLPLRYTRQSTYYPSGIPNGALITPLVYRPTAFHTPPVYQAGHLLPLGYTEKTTFYPFGIPADTSAASTGDSTCQNSSSPSDHEHQPKHATRTPRRRVISLTGRRGHHALNHRQSYQEIARHQTLRCAKPRHVEGEHHPRRCGVLRGAHPAPRHHLSR